MKIVTIVGARPQFIKAAAVSRKLRQCHDEFLVNTGQHYDYEMSGIFFDGLELPKPSASLGIGSGSHGYQTGEMLKAIEDVLVSERPDYVLIYGDTNSTLAGALAAAKLSIPIAHVEAGLRSFNRQMPEEINRVLSDHLSSLLLCPSDTAVSNLAAEGIFQNVHLVGDVMLDILNWARQRVAASPSGILERRRHAVRKRGRRFSRLNASERHRLRIAVKKLRYTVELLGSLYDPRELRRFTDRLKSVQEDLGHANDLRAAYGLVIELSRQAEPAEPVIDAAAELLAWHQRAVAAGEHKLRRRLHRLNVAEPFWRE